VLRQRALSATIGDHLKTICQIEHTRHRRPITLLVHLVCGLIAYCHLPKKPPHLISTRTPIDSPFLPPNVTRTHVH
jgi:hypothetical protein